MFEHTLKLPQAEPFSLVAALINAYPDEDYYVYEKPAESWHIALGIQAALVLTPTTMMLSRFGHPTVNESWQGDISAIARRFAQNEGGDGWNIYGQAAFEYAAHVQGISSGRSSEEGWPLLSLMVPRTEITVRLHDVVSVTVRTRDIDTLQAMQALLTGEMSLRSDYKTSPIDTEIGRDDYQRGVEEILDEIQAGHYQKVNLSRQVPVPRRIDMLRTYLQVRPRNTPFRSYLIKFMGREVVGCSPELLIVVRGRTVYTQPLAGTRALTGRAADDAALRQDMLSDPKEIAEHAMAVFGAIKEIERICQPGNAKIDDFMSIIERGSVQHFASMVTGALREDKDAWDAFDMVFPFNTASARRKEQMIRVILQKEKCSRALYNGAVLMSGEKELEASLVLRSAFQEPGKSWLQAGACVTALSTPEREFQETKEKLASVAPYIVLEN